MAKSRDPRVRIANAYRGQRRTIRRPQVPFQLRTRPFQIQPFMCHPVLPGETLKNALVQSRVVTDPIKHALVGWWTEYFIFFVKHRDIGYHLGSDALEQMVLNPNWDSASLESAADQKTYHAGGGINYTRLALETVVEWYFRDQGEDHDVATLDGLPLAQITGRTWMDSLTLEPDLIDTSVKLDVDGDGDPEAHELLEAQMHWEALRAAGLEDMDYEDYLRTFGVQVRQPDASPNLYRPELVRYTREWTYPTNTINPENGAAASAASWAVAFRADKDRFFREPGFLLGLTVTRPKVYSGQQVGSLHGEMKNVFTWLPAILQNQHEKAFVRIAGDEGPLADIFDDGSEGFHDYVVDMRDLFTYGDQFINFAADASGSFMNGILADGSRRYPDATSIDNLFSGDNKTIRQDGIVTLAIAGRQQDKTPTSLPLRTPYST